MGHFPTELTLALGAIAFLVSFFLPDKRWRYLAAGLGVILLVAGALAGWLGDQP